MGMTNATQASPLWRDLKVLGEITPDGLLRLLEIRTPPVNVEFIARQLGVQVVFAPLSGLSGSVTSDDSGASIHVEASDPRVRQRFTIAHEIGHLMLHEDGEIHHRDVDYRPGGSPVERQANDFAACLLMPEWMLGPAISALGRDVSRLASLFDVSESAMRWRLTNLKLAGA